MDETRDESPPVEAPPASPGDALRHELVPTLSAEDERRLADRIRTDHHAAITDRSEWETRLAEWEDQYYNRVPDKTFPWPGCSNFHVPLTMMGVETYKPRLVDGVLGQIPPVILRPSKGADETRKDAVEAFLNWQLLTEIDLESRVTQSAHLFLQPGLVIAKTYWSVHRRQKKLVREFPLATTLDAIFRSIFGTERPQDWESTDELTWTGTLPASPQAGGPLSVRLKLKFLSESIQALLEQDEVVERPAIDLVDPIDLFVPVKGGHEIAELPWCQVRLWMSEDELRERARLGRFSADVVEELLEAHGHLVGDQPTTESRAYQAGKSVTEGVQDQGPSNVRRSQWEILEDYRRWDVDGSGESQEIISWYAMDLPQRLLGWDYLSNVYAHGRRPLRVGRYFPIPFRFYGLSFAETVRGIQDEINSIHNQRNDYGTIQNLPFYFYRASATHPATTQALKPGQGVPIDNPQQDVLFPSWRGSTAWGAQEEAILHQYFERLSGLTDLSIGRQPNRVGATRTARGTQTLLSEAGLRFKVALNGFQRFWIGVFSDVLALDQEYLPPRTEFRVTGRRPAAVRLADRTQIAGQYDLRLASTAETLNREQVRQDSSLVLQAMMNPALLQSGLLGMKGVRRLYSDLLKAFGRDPEFYLEDKAVIRNPSEELMMFAAGQYVSPVAGENVREHLEAHQAALSDPLVPPEVKQLIARHVQETLQLAQALQMAQSMQQAQGGGRPPIGPQALNAEQGKQPQAPAATTTSAGAGMPDRAAAPGY